jgi:hypothetical protein
VVVHTAGGDCAVRRPVWLLLAALVLIAETLDVLFEFVEGLRYLLLCLLADVLCFLCDTLYGTTHTLDDIWAVIRVGHSKFVYSPDSYKFTAAWLDAQPGVWVSGSKPGLPASWLSRTAWHSSRGASGHGDVVLVTHRPAVVSARRASRGGRVVLRQDPSESGGRRHSDPGRPTV